jgi:hypothetical protein
VHVTVRERILVWLIGATVALVGPPAHAESTKTQCIQANTNAQTLRREGKLTEARVQLRACSEAKCPSLVSADCIKRLDELESAQPTVIFDVFDAAGHEVNDVNVSVDGHPLLDRLEGKSVPVDLGEHVVTFSPQGRPAVTQKLVFREGEKSRHVRVVVDNAPGAPAAAGAVAATEPATEQAAGSPAEPVEPAPPAASGSSGSSQRTVGYLVGGVGLAGLAVGGIFGYLTISAKDRQTDNCASEAKCPDYGAASAAHQDATTYGTISTVAFIVGGAATATGLVLVLTAKPANRGVSSAAPRRISRLALAPTGGAGSAGVELSGAW